MNGPRLQRLLEEVAPVPARELRQLPEDLVAVVAVEVRRLKAERIQVDAVGAALAGLVLAISIKRWPCPWPRTSSRSQNRSM